MNAIAESNNGRVVKGRTGVLFVISAPSGAGKTTLCRALLEHFPDIEYSISFTTRQPRKGEKNGLDYHFVDKGKFRAKLKKGCWAEWAEVHGHYYGTSADLLDRSRAAGDDVLLDIDVQGAIQILERYPDAVTIFIMPPSMTVLEERLRKRGTDSRTIIATRLRNAQAEIAQKDIYRHVIVNDNLQQAIAELIQIVNSYRTQQA
jgi:guanylate kinase